MLIHELVKHVQFFMSVYISNILLYLLLMHFKGFVTALNEIFLNDFFFFFLMTFSKWLVLTWRKSIVFVYLGSN